MSGHSVRGGRKAAKRRRRAELIALVSAALGERGYEVPSWDHVRTAQLVALAEQLELDVPDFDWRVVAAEILAEREAARAA